MKFPTIKRTNPIPWTAALLNWNTSSPKATEKNQILMVLMVPHTFLKTEETSLVTVREARLRIKTEIVEANTVRASPEF